jgi:hypothetical protein
MEDAYIEKKITKTKVHSWLSERTGGLLADMASNIRINIGPDDGSRFFLKKCLQRD